MDQVISSRYGTWKYFACFLKLSSETATQAKRYFRRDVPFNPKCILWQTKHYFNIKKKESTLNLLYIRSAPFLYDFIQEGISPLSFFPWFAFFQLDLFDHIKSIRRRTYNFHHLLFEIYHLIQRIFVEFSYNLIACYIQHKAHAAKNNNYQVKAWLPK